MFDFGDVFLNTAEMGGEGRGWRSIWAIGGALAGLGIAAYVAFQTGGIVPALGAAPVGALVGWLVGIFLRGFAIFAAIFVCVAVVLWGWDWLTGL